MTTLMLDYAPVTLTVIAKDFCTYAQVHYGSIMGIEKSRVGGSHNPVLLEKLSHKTQSLAVYDKQCSAFVQCL